MTNVNVTHSCEEAKGKTCGCAAPGTDGESREVSEACCGTNYFRPLVDVADYGTELVLKADIPGATEDQIDISFEKGRLSIEAPIAEHSKDACPPQEGLKALRTEFGPGVYYRTFELGKEIDSTKISASYEDGILTLRLPKAEEVLSRKIPISH